MRIVAEPIAVEDVWSAGPASPELSVFSSPEWLRFLQRSQGATPVALRLLLDGTEVGWFTGAVVRRGGLRLLGSPLPGWTTSYMGVALSQAVTDASSLDPSAVRRAALSAVRRVALRNLRCAHLEVLDRALDPDDPLPRGLVASPFHSFELDLAGDEQLLRGMSTNARRNLARAERKGVQVDVVDRADAPDFASVYYRHALETFAKRSVVPPYPRERVEQLIETVHPSGRLLLLRARTSGGEVAATGIFAGVPGGTATFLMGASRQEHLVVRPNEALMWRALTWWRDQGAVRFDFGGGGDYKLKFGPRPIRSAWVRTSLPGSEAARAFLRRQVRRRQRRTFAAGVGVRQADPYTESSTPQGENTW